MRITFNLARSVAYVSIVVLVVPFASLRAQYLEDGMGVAVTRYTCIFTGWNGDFGWNSSAQDLAESRGFDSTQFSYYRYLGWSVVRFCQLTLMLPDYRGEDACEWWTAQADSFLTEVRTTKPPVEFRSTHAALDTMWQWATKAGRKRIQSYREMNPDGLMKSSDLDMVYEMTSLMICNAFNRESTTLNTGNSK